MEFRTLGPLQVVDAGQALALGSGLQRAVLALLLVDAPEPVSVDRLIDELWGERPPASAQHAVQVYVSAIRKILRTTHGDVSVRTTGSGYALETDPDLVDARRFERLVGEAQHVGVEDPSRAAGLFGEALGLWRGPPLVEFAQFEFARREADRLEELHTTAVEGLVEARLACGEHAEVLGMITGLVAAGPLRERPRRLLMLALYRSGRHAEALAAYRDACAALDEIGLQPGPELRQLEAAILRHDSSLGVPSTAPDARDASAIDISGPGALGQPSLPAAPHPLVGRRSELLTVLELLAGSDVRLVSLLGPGGSGKTRLALEVANELVEHYRDGVWFVSLAPLADPALVASVIARTLGVDEDEGQPLQVALAEALARRELMLVLDNFEHLVAAAGVVGELLAASPGLDVLVTSREALNLRGEHRIEIGGLPLADAVELFVLRARAVRRDLADENGRDAVERICLRLDGLPLALELAAARVALFSVAALETRLAQRLDLPAGARDLPDRQRTLRATIDWSYQLLSPAEQALFRGLAPFAGGARLEAIDAIFTDLGVAPVDTVAALVDKSLLGRRDDDDGMPRFWMLETIREYAAECAAREDDADAVADRHARHFYKLAEEVERHLATADQRVWLGRLETDHDNLRVAFDHLLTRDPSRVLTLACLLRRFWEIRGNLTEARERLRRALASAPPEGAAAAEATDSAAWFAYLQGDGQEAERLAAETLRLAREASETRVEASALMLLGIVTSQDNAPRSLKLLEEALALARTANSDRLLMRALNNLGTLLDVIGDPDRGRPLLEEALELSRRLGETQITAMSAGNLAEVALVRGDLDLAAPLISETLHSARQIGFSSGVSWALSLDALLALKRNELRTAEERINEALTAIRDAYEVQTGQIVLAVAATLAATRGEPLLAAQLWAALHREISTQPALESPLVTQLREESLEIARAASDTTAWEAAWAVGTKLHAEQALELAARA